MNKRMKELLEQIKNKNAEARKCMASKEIEKANTLIDDAAELQKEYETEKRLFESEKSQVPDHKKPDTKKTGSGFSMITKMLKKKELDDTEKALVVNGTDGENFLIPQDVHLGIIEMRKQFKAAKPLLFVIPTSTLSGSFNYEEGKATGLVNFTDGEKIDDSDKPKVGQKKYQIELFGKSIPISNVLLDTEGAGLKAYIRKWFVKNAIISENRKIFEELKVSKTPKDIVGWKALKSSINKDLDPSALLDGVIITNQTGFNILDSAEDKNGKPILKDNPADKTKKIFQSMIIEVFSDAVLKNIGDKAPIFYGSMKAGAYYMDYKHLQFAISPHAGFDNNQTKMRVIEGFDVIQADSDAYIYGTLSPETSVGE